jgi:hypothetical protein
VIYGPGQTTTGPAAARRRASLAEQMQRNVS